MAHECPNCGMCCYCGGDIDDLLLNDEEDVMYCRHCDDDDNPELYDEDLQ